MEGKQHGALNLYRSRGTKGILVQSFHTLHVKKCSLTEGLIAFWNTLTRCLTQKSVSAIQPARSLQLYAAPTLLPSYGVMTMLRAASKSERLDSQLVLFRFPCQRPTAKAILGCMSINLPGQEKQLLPSPLSYSISTR